MAFLLYVPLSLHTLGMSSQIGSVDVAHSCFIQEDHELFEKLLCYERRASAGSITCCALRFTVFIKPTNNIKLSR